jgi:hypothetical protein
MKKPEELMNTPRLIDNYLSPRHFQTMTDVIFGEDIPWYYMDCIDYFDDVDKFQFTHAFFDKELGGILSNYFDLFNIIEDPLRINAKLITRTSEIKVNRFHTDIAENERGMGAYTTSVLYMNTCDGYTELEDGTKVESVANRLFSFPEKMEHRGTSCTDKKCRVVININSAVF